MSVDGFNPEAERLAMEAAIEQPTLSSELARLPYLTPGEPHEGQQTRIAEFSLEDASDAKRNGRKPQLVCRTVDDSKHFVELTLPEHVRDLALSVASPGDNGLSTKVTFTEATPLTFAGTRKLEVTPVLDDLVGQLEERVNEHRESKPRPKPRGPEKRWHKKGLDLPQTKEGDLEYVQARAQEQVREGKPRIRTLAKESVQDAARHDRLPMWQSATIRENGREEVLVLSADQAAKAEAASRPTSEGKFELRASVKPVKVLRVSPRRTVLLVELADDEAVDQQIAENETARPQYETLS